MTDVIRILRSVSEGNEVDPQDLRSAAGVAADFIEQHPRKGKYSYYYTFGSDPQFPFGRDEYVVVHGDTEKDADAKFKAYFPNRPGSECLNCAFVYDEEHWKHCSNYYDGEPAMVIE